MFILTWVSQLGFIFQIGPVFYLLLVCERIRELRSQLCSYIEIHNAVVGLSFSTLANPLPQAQAFCSSLPKPT